MTLSELLTHPAVLPAIATSVLAFAAVLVKAYIDKRTMQSGKEDKDEDRQASMRKTDLEILNASERVYRETVMRDLDSTKQRLAAAERASEQCRRRYIRLESKFYRLSTNYDIMKTSCTHITQEIMRLNPNYRPMVIPELDLGKDEGEDEEGVD
jgi:hypothetical protein